MSDLATTIKGELTTDEQLIAVIDNLKVDIKFVPYVRPNDNYSPYLSGAIALTNFRIIVIMWDGKVWKWFYTSGLSWYSERFLSRDKSSWPYQAIIMLPSGMGVILQSDKPDREQQKQLSTLLVQAFIRFSTHYYDSGAIAAMTAYEEEQKRQREDATTSKTKK